MKTPERSCDTCAEPRCVMEKQCRLYSEDNLCFWKDKGETKGVELDFTSNVTTERISRKTMLDRNAWSLKEALAYQPAEILSVEPVKRMGRVIAWLVKYKYQLKES